MRRVLAIMSMAVLAASAAMSAATSTADAAAPPEATSRTPAGTPTVVVADDPVAPVIAAAGDIACPPPGTRKSGGCHQMATAALLTSGGYDAVLTIGDNQYFCGQLSAYYQVYDPSWGQVKSITHPIPGEDDYSGNGCSTPGASGYFTYFGDAATPREPGCTKACQGYYSYDLGAWHVVALNTACSEPGVGGCATSNPQVQWLAGDLADHPTRCTLGVMHRPYWANGTKVTKFRDLVKAMYDGGVDVLLTGNSHIYTRYAPQNPDSQVVSNGIRAFIVGTGGKSHSTLKTPLPHREAANDRTFGVLKLTLHAASYDWEFVPEAGSSYTDSGSTDCT